MESAEKIRVHILTGFLGSGKTTLLNRMLAMGAFADTAVVVNELGEIGLDHLLVTEKSDQIALLEGGCLCCAVVDSLPETLLELCRRRSGGEVTAFSRIVIETTGLADPGPIVEAIRRSPLLSHFLAPGVIATALDMQTALAVPARHPEAMRQLVLADRIVLTKLDLRGAMTPEEEAGLAAINPLAEVLPAEALAGEPGRLIAPVPLRQARPDVPPAGGAHHSHGVRAWSIPVEPVVTRSGLAAFAAALDLRLGPSLLRCKGVVRTARGPVLIQGVGNRFSFADAPAQAAAVTPHITCIVQDRARDEVVALIPWLHVSEGTLPPTQQDIP